MGQIQEPVFIEAFIMEFPDEALGKSIIRRPPGPYVLNGEGLHLCPLVEDSTGKLETIINANPFNGLIRRSRLGRWICENLPEKILGRELWQCDRYIITPLGHPLSKKKQMTNHDIARYPIVMPDKGDISCQALDRKLRTHNPNLRVTVEAGNWEVVAKYVELGFGVSVLPGICENAKDNDRIYLRPSSDILWYSRYGILLKKGKYVSPAARALIKSL
jgi:DNA-binding transcriptional LysR family regulator